MGAIKTDAPVKGTFEEGYDDVISLATFHFEHVYGGWYLASKKSSAGHRFSLIVNDEEREELLELQEEYALQRKEGA